jgi:hypothetical protein
MEERDVAPVLHGMIRKIKALQHLFIRLIRLLAAFA